MFADYCPTVDGYSDMNCRFLDETGRSAGFTAAYGGSFSEASRCVETHLFDKQYVFQDVGAGCYNVRCVSGTRLSIQVGSAWQVCSRAGELLSLAGFTGSVVCPDPAELCGVAGGTTAPPRASTSSAALPSNSAPPSSTNGPTSTADSTPAPSARSQPYALTSGAAVDGGGGDDGTTPVVPPDAPDQPEPGSSMVRAGLAACDVLETREDPLPYFSHEFGVETKRDMKERERRERKGRSS